MPRFMTIWLPRWPVQRRLLDRPELRRVPMFVCRRERRGTMTVVSWAWPRPPRSAAAAPARIVPGMSLAEALAVLATAHGSRACRLAEVDHDDPAADLAGLEQLARWCRRFAPAAGVEQAAGGLEPECIHVDVSGTAGFFGGEAALARTAAWTLAARGLHARSAIADTCAAAWAAAHHTDLAASGSAADVQAPRQSRRWAVVASGAQRLEAGRDAALSGLPVAALRLDAATIDMLREVGIDTIGGVLRLSAKSLASRFPPLVARRLAEFTGTLAEPLVGPRGDELPRAHRPFDCPVAAGDASEDALVAVVAELVSACLAPLVAGGRGVLALQVRLERAGGGTTPGHAPTVIDVGLFQPSASVRHLVELVRLRLGRMRPPDWIDGITVEVLAAGSAPCRQRFLFAADDGTEHGARNASSSPETGMLLDRLSGRLGRAAVFVPRAVADPQPEHAWIATPPGVAPARHVPSGTTRRRRDDAPARRPPAGRRPIWMAPRPVRLAAGAGLVAVAPDGPPVQFRFAGRLHRIATAYGPERIETAWWRGPTVRRDYYVVETESGARFWLFRRLRDGGWFLHGAFA